MTSSEAASLSIAQAAQLTRNSFQNLSDWMSRVDFGMSFEENFKPTTYIETVQPLYQDDGKNDTIFIQPRLNYEGEVHLFGNLGVGWRRYFRDWNAMGGVNVFGDHEFDSGLSRVGTGAEFFTEDIDFRINGYFRVGQNRALIQETDVNVIYERVVNGMDFEVGVPVPYMPNARIYGGGETYDYKFSKNLTGIKGRLEIKPSQLLTFNLHVSDNNKNKTDWRLDARVSLNMDDGWDWKPLFSNKFKEKKRDVPQMALVRVEREHRIKKERYGVNKTTGISFEIGRA